MALLALLWAPCAWAQGLRWHIEAGTDPALMAWPVQTRGASAALGAGGGAGTPSPGTSDRRRPGATWGIGAGLSYTQALSGDLSLALRGGVALGRTAAVFPDGIGVFVEPILVEVTSVTVTAEAYTRYRQGAARYSLDGGLGHSRSSNSLVWSMGNWTVTSHEYGQNTYGFLRANLHTRLAPLALPSRETTFFAKLSHSPRGMAAQLGLDMEF